LPDRKSSQESTGPPAYPDTGGEDSTGPRTSSPPSAQDRSEYDNPEYPEFEVHDVVAGYDSAATALVPEYEGVSFENVHAPVLKWLPQSPAWVLDVGAGSGRDAAWFARKGHNVVAVEPSRQLRAVGKACHGSSAIKWIGDELPALAKVVRSKLTFDLVWLSAVWTHVPPNGRRRAFRKLVSLMSPGGSMMLSLRHGPPPRGRPMHSAEPGDIEKLAQEHGLQIVSIQHQQDAGNRPGIAWDVIWLRLPDDGTGALPLLRHIVFNDQKSSTYKLALLRVLLRIADNTGGFVRREGEHHVDLPLGLVALFWVRTFRQLVAEGFPQHPKGNSHLSFAKDAFRGLETRSPYDLRIGQQFTGDDAENLVVAIRDAVDCIRRMPATYITYPRSDKPVFPTERRGPVRLRDSLRLDESFLWSFGTFSVPVNLWQAMSRYAPWIEPAILNEWVHVMRGYERTPTEEASTPWDKYMNALRWLVPDHDTSFVRQLAEDLRNGNSGLFCVWTGRRLTHAFDIDHCFPFAAWPCNDLWNLLPSYPATNRRKGDQLPTRHALEEAEPRILDWWGKAYWKGSAVTQRFIEECRSALPMAVSDSGNVTLESVFEGVTFQQMVLKRDQQLSEWHPNPAGR